MFCPNCGVEYRPGFTQCVDCNVSLVSELIETHEDPDLALVTVRRFYNLPEASLARAKLESEGVSAYLRDEYAVGVDWFWARAIGGIRLVVAARSTAIANDILERDDSPSLEGMPESQLSPSHSEACPSCGSRSILEPRWGRRFRALSIYPGFVLVALLTLSLERYRCSECKHRWR